LLCLIGITYSSCDKVKGKGEVVSQTRNVTGFTGFSLGIDGTIYFSTDSVFYVEVKAQQNILDVLETVLDNNQLIIRYKKNVSIGTHEAIEIFISAPAVNKVQLSGSGDIQVTNAWNQPYIETAISGSGNISVVQLDAGELNSSISGSGNFTAQYGKINQEELTISGSGNIDLVGVEADTTYATISGSGNISVWVTQLLDVTISGSGNVRYKGSPVIITKISGSGSIIQI